MSQLYNENTKKPKPKENQQGILGISSREFAHFAGNLAKGLRSRRALLGRCIYLSEYTKKFLHLSPKSYHNLVVQRKAQLEHSSFMVKVGVEATC